MSHALTLMQWLSPAFPVGAFAYSHGLEQVIADEVVADADTLRDWLGDLLEHGSGRADAILLAASYRADDPADVDATARAFAAGAERLKETDLQGAAFCDTASAVWGIEIAGLTYPVAVGAAARAVDIPLAETVPLYLHAFASNLVSVAQRALPLGQTDGQTVLAALSPIIAETAQEAEKIPLEALSSASFAADIAAMRHETLQPRIFRT
ncbi:urease accessory UreF family protein [Tateyamaria sp. ANG-S1]|uniref:urease accessory protein UreF n=1 Tax=Tateyamaria sp. ANG-S1 TaxID=1577905 RepID=UPI00057F897D|nr:urease accessory UreF family protein [Tateyamaria sp. ANG-S1]KIC50433.1 urease accessory protein UreF [Tateyamaria sp. ANG-S1]